MRYLPTSVLKRLKSEVTLGQGCVVDCCSNNLQFVYGFLVPMSLGSPLLHWLWTWSCDLLIANVRQSETWKMLAHWCLPSFVAQGATTTACRMMRYIWLGCSHHFRQVQIIFWIHERGHPRPSGSLMTSQLTIDAWASPARSSHSWPRSPSQPKTREQ